MRIPVNIPALLSIFANSIVPILVIAAIGFLLSRYLHADVKTFSSLIFYILSPALIFNTLVTETLGADEFARLSLFTVGIISAAGLVSFILTWPLRLAGPERNAFVIVGMFGNAGNYGLPLVLFAFGQDAPARATVYLVVHVILLYSFGVLLASSGHSGWRAAITRVLRVPHLYAIAAATLVMVTRTTLPDAIMRPVGLLNSAALPMMILLMGMQIQQSARPERPIVVGVATGLKLVVMPVLALGLAALMGLTGADRQAAVIQAAMPAAVMITVLAVEFQTAPAFVTGVVFLSTVLSPLTLTLFIALLQ